MIRFLLFLQCVVLLLLISSLPVAAQPDLTGEPVPAPGALPVQIKQMLSLQVSPDGKLVAATFAHLQRFPELDRYEAVAGSMQVWDVATGERKWSVGPENGEFYGVYFSPDSKRVFFLWAKVKPQVEPQKRIIIPKIEKFRAELRDASTGAMLFPLELEEREIVQRAFFTPNGRQIIGSLVQFPEVEGTVSAETIKKWDALSGKQLQPSEALPVPEGIFDFFPDRQRILTQSISDEAPGKTTPESSLAVLSWPALQPLDTIAFPDNRASLVAFSPDGTRVGFTTYQPLEPRDVSDPAITVWNLEKKVLQTLESPGEGPYLFQHLEFSRDGKTLIGSRYLFDPYDPPVVMMYFWNTDSGELQRRFEIERKTGEEHYGTTFNTALGIDGKTFFVTSTAIKVEQRSLKDGALIRTFE